MGLLPKLLTIHRSWKCLDCQNSSCTPCACRGKRECTQIGLWTVYNRHDTQGCDKPFAIWTYL